MPDLASWWSRVAAELIDAVVTLVPTVVLVAAGFLVSKAGSGVDPATGRPDSVALVTVGGAMVLLGMIVAYAIQIWNKGVRQGRRGSSIGKGAMRIAVVRELDGQYQGATQGFVRWLMYFVFGSLCLLDFLWPLWDAKNQTWHDKVVGTLVVRRS